MNYGDEIINPDGPGEHFQKELLEYLDQYKAFLLDNKKRGAVKRCDTLHTFITYLCAYHPVSGFEDIRFAWCSSGFTGYCKWELDEEIKTSLSRNYIRDFFAFIYEQHGIANKKLLDKLSAAK